MNRIDFTNSIQGCSLNDILSEYFVRSMIIYNILDGSSHDIKIDKTNHDSFIVIFNDITEANIVYDFMMSSPNISMYGETYTCNPTINENRLDITFIQI